MLRREDWFSVLGFGFWVFEGGSSGKGRGGLGFSTVFIITIDYDYAYDDDYDAERMKAGRVSVSG